MAQRYVVKAKDNPLTLAAKFETSPQAILQNNAIKSLTAGQTIKIPTSGSLSGDKQGQLGTVPKTPFAINTNPLFVSPTQTQTNGSFVSGGGQVNTAQIPRSGNIPTNVTNSGYLSQNGAFVSTQAQSNVHAQVPIFGQITSAQLQQQIAQANAAQAPATPARPQGVYTGNPNDPNTAAWKNYWNYSAQHPETAPASAPVVMTRDQVWNMKAAQRRRENKGGGGGDTGYQPYLQPVQPVYEPFFGNNVVQGSFRG
jgi:hypothetical protein